MERAGFAPDIAGCKPAKLPGGCRHRKRVSYHAAAPECRRHPARCRRRICTAVIASGLLMLSRAVARTGGRMQRTG